MALTDNTQLNGLFSTFLTALATADAADAALQGAVSNFPTLRNNALTSRQAALLAYNDVLRQIGIGSMTAQQRQQFRRVLGDLDDLNPGELGGQVRKAIEGAG